MRRPPPRPRNRPPASRPRLLRLAGRRTLVEVAGLADISVAHLADIETGKVVASPAIIGRLAKVLGVPPGTLFPAAPGGDRHGEADGEDGEGDRA